MPTGIRITKEKKYDVVNYYKSKPMTIRECANHCGLSNPTIIKLLNEFGIDRYKKAKINSPELDENYFSNINTEEKAYFLGLLISDGNVFVCGDGNRQASISITQAESDAYILKRFLEEVRSNTTIGHDGRGTCQATIRSNIMAHSLSSYGVVPEKTLTAYLPIIEDQYMQHLIRGILDGDGSITSTLTSRNKHKHAISFCGTHQLMEGISQYISLVTGATRAKVYDYSDRHLSEIKWQSVSDVLLVGDWIYRDATIFLERKRKLYSDIEQRYK